MGGDLAWGYYIYIYYPFGRGIKQAADLCNFSRISLIVMHCFGVGNIMTLGLSKSWGKIENEHVLLALIYLKKILGLYLETFMKGEFISQFSSHLMCRFS